MISALSAIRCPVAEPDTIDAAHSFAYLASEHYGALATTQRGYCRKEPGMDIKSYVTPPGVSSLTTAVGFAVGVLVAMLVIKHLPLPSALKP